MKLRKAKEKDLQNFIELRTEYLKRIDKQNKTSEEVDINKIKKEFQIFLKKDKLFFVAEEKKKIIGYIAGNIFINPWNKGGYIDDLYVSNNFRKKGIGKNLIKKFLEELKKRKIKTCQLGVSKTNKKAQNLYKKLGFDIVHYEMGIKLK